MTILFKFLLDYIEPGLNCEFSQQQFTLAIERPLSKIRVLIDEVVNQTQCRPDFVYLTGGSAKPPVIRAAVNKKRGIELVDGDHFGSVAAGLTVWANRLFA